MDIYHSKIDQKTKLINIPSFLKEYIEHIIPDWIDSAYLAKYVYKLDKDYLID